MLDRRTAPTAQVLKAGLQVIHVSLVRVHGEYDVLRLVLAPHGKLLVKFLCLRARRSDLELGEQKKPSLHRRGSSGRATRGNLNLKNYDHSSPIDSSTVPHSPLCQLVLHLPPSSSRLTDAAGVGTQIDGTASRYNAQLLHRGREKTSSTSITACSIAEICVFTHLLPSSSIRNGETRSCGTRLPPAFSRDFLLALLAVEMPDATRSKCPTRSRYKEGGSSDRRTSCGSRSANETRATFQLSQRSSLTPWPCVSSIEVASMLHGCVPQIMRRKTIARCTTTAALFARGLDLDSEVVWHGLAQEQAAQ